jgi:hypothetical protein
VYPEQPRALGTLLLQWSVQRRVQNTSTDTERGSLSYAELLATLGPGCPVDIVRRLTDWTIRRVRPEEGNFLVPGELACRLGTACISGRDGTGMRSLLSPVPHRDVVLHWAEHT